MSTTENAQFRAFLLIHPRKIKILALPERILISLTIDSSLPFTTGSMRKDKKGRKTNGKNKGVKMLSNKELALVATKLQVPLIVSDILSGQGELTDDVHYGLHSVISDQQPDSALLCIALSGLKIANVFHRASPGISVLKIQCESVINDYAALWLQNAENEDVSEIDAMDALSCVSEDLEGLSELLDLAVGFLQSKDETAASLAKILSVQAKSQAMIADEFYGVLYSQVTDAETPKVSDAIAGKATNGNDNVIPFRKRA
jgi:hypothetical protein